MQLAPFRVLSEDEIERIHAASLRLLWQPGIRMCDPDLMRVLAEAGCRLEESADRVRYPAELVAELLAEVPDKFDVRGYGHHPGVTIGDGKPRFGSGMQASFVIEPGEETRRPAAILDVAQFVRLSEKLEGIDLVATPAVPQDVPPEQSLVLATGEMLRHTTKPLVIAPFIEDDARALLRIMEVEGESGDGASRWICQQSMRSPLCLPPDMGAVMRTVIPVGIPLLFHTAPQTGISAPYTLAGLLVQYHAEMLGAIVAGQAVMPGAPCLYGGGWGTSDMAHLQRHLSTPEACLLRIAGSQLAQRFRIPYHSIGPDTDSPLPNEQAALEKTLTASAAVGAGVDLQVNAGLFATGMNISLAQLVIDSEILGIVRRMAEGIRVDEERIGEDVIAEAGVSGDYITASHTIRHLHGGEHRKSALFAGEEIHQRGGDEIPCAAGRAKQMADDLLRESPPSVLPPDRLAALADTIADSFRRRKTAPPGTGPARPE